MVVGAAQLQGCALLLTEDLQDGAVFGDVTVRSPFTLEVRESAAAYAVTRLRSPATVRVTGRSAEWRGTSREVTLARLITREKGIGMQQESIAGSCLCGAVRFEIKPPLAGFRYCHCSRCRKATGAAHAANVFLPQSQLTWLAGESLIRRFDLPSAKRFAVCFCTQCGTRVPHKITGTENYLVPAGILESSPEQRPEGSIFWASRAPWYVETQELPKFDEYGK